MNLSIIDFFSKLILSWGLTNSDTAYGQSCDCRNWLRLGPVSVVHTVTYDDGEEIVEEGSGVLTLTQKWVRPWTSEIETSISEGVAFPCADMNYPQFEALIRLPVEGEIVLHYSRQNYKVKVVMKKL